jgi:hypothetical protein
VPPPADFPASRAKREKYYPDDENNDPDRPENSDLGHEPDDQQDDAQDYHG